jgi:hypothetical protein
MAVLKIVKPEFPTDHSLVPESLGFRFPPNSVLVVDEKPL